MKVTICFERGEIVEIERPNEISAISFNDTIIHLDPFENKEYIMVFRNKKDVAITTMEVTEGIEAVIQIIS